ncbi:MAG TPA: ATP-binding protein [Anaeromyxobacteraceae bacterium]|nr:ATP-binding protein [Anaeromyxobacteraceae bacterium]
MPKVPLPEEELLARLRWFIRVRWLFLSGLAVAILVGRTMLGPGFPVAKAAAAGAVVLAYNLLFVLYHAWLRPRGIPHLTTSRIEAGLQIGLDLLALTTLVHLTGGAENPFVGFYLFHAIVGSMLLSREEAWLVGFGSCLLFLSVVGLEYAGILPHFHPHGPSEASRHQFLPYVAMVSAGFVITVFSTIAITSSIVGSLRLREQQLVATKRALVKNAEDLERAYSTLTEKQHQLIQAEKQASLGQLVAGIAHEINNPIQFIHGNMSILSEAFDDILPLLDDTATGHPELRVARLEYPFFRKQVAVLLKDLVDGAARIAALVRDLKAFARRDEGRLDEEVDLNEAVRSSLRLLHNQLKHFRVEEQLEPALPHLRGNATQLQQVVVNTLQNAVEACDHRAGARIRVRTRTEPGQGQVRLSIEDSGSGMTEEVKGRIFDPFFTTKQRTGGTGLGLAITYGIVQQHRGQIEVESRVGQGTTFHYLLPLGPGGAA